MHIHKTIGFYTALYSWLLLLYPTHYYNRFGPEMESIFNEILEEKSQESTHLLSFALGIYIETFISIIKENITFYSMKPITLIRPLLVTLTILLIPLVAMQFDNGVDWSVFDFVLAGGILMLVGTIIELVISKTTNLYYRLATVLTVFTSAFLFLSNGAVGIVGSEDERINIVYYALLLILVLGTLISRFKPRSMAITLFTIVIIQTLITLGGLVLGWQNLPAYSVFELIAANGFFIALYFVSGGLYFISSLTHDSTKIAQS